MDMSSSVLHVAFIRFVDVNPSLLCASFNLLGKVGYPESEFSVTFCQFSFFKVVKLEL